MTRFLFLKSTVIILCLFTYNPITIAQLTQQGPKLIGTQVVGHANQAYSVSISGDGNTAIVGGPGDNGDVGAAWIYVRSGEIWSQQGPKLIGANSMGNASQGYSVSISGDGNTAIVGGIDDNNSTGAAWVYTRTDGVWTQQGLKLFGTGATGAAQEGSSVSLSADGNTAIVGGQSDNNSIGAVWIYTRTAGIWMQVGSKLVGTEVVGTATQGYSVSLSGDGNTAIVGGSGDDNFVGAVWVFIRTAGGWTQQGPKLIGTGAIGNAGQGSWVSISADGNTAIVGGLNDNTKVGASWIFSRVDGTWSQQGSKLTAMDASGEAGQGVAVSISADGKTAVVGGFGDNNNEGAVWLYKYSNGAWVQDGNKLIGTGAVGKAQQGGAVSISSDGTTLILGGSNDNTFEGAAWIFNANTLPLNFINIHSADSNGDILLVWQVASGKDVLSYLIQRSTDGINFNQVGTLTGSQSNFYQWTDTSALAGVSFYRVKGIELSGEVKYSDIVKVLEDSKLSAIKIGPNPVEGNILNMYFKNQEKGTYLIRVIDENGRIVLSTSIHHMGGNSSQIINLPTIITTGSYQLTVISPQKTINTQQLIIRRIK